MRHYTLWASGRVRLGTEVQRLRTFHQDTLSRQIKMSDYEDDMDIDGLPLKESVQFGSLNAATKQKRIVADLPIEAEDNLPWYANHSPWFHH